MDEQSASDSVIASQWSWDTWNEAGASEQQLVTLPDQDLPRLGKKEGQDSDQFAALSSKALKPL